MELASAVTARRRGGGVGKAAVGAVRSASGEPADEKPIASAFTGADKARLAELLATLAAIGKARQLEDGRYVAA